MKLWIAMAFLVMTATSAFALDEDSSLLTIDRIFSKKEFSTEQVSPFHWSHRDASYFNLKGDNDQRQLIRLQLQTGEEEVIVGPKDLTPEGASSPLKVESFQFSKDEAKLLIFTNSQRVWRHNTRGDFWVLDLKSQQLCKLGGDAAPSTLMFAKFSPDGTRVAYVRENNLYVETLEDGSIQQLTNDGSENVINGTSDWVNEEELAIRDAYRWSPDGRQIAFWQFNTSGVQRFHMIDNLEGNYPRLITFPYPKVGETNSAVRAGVVTLEGGNRDWFDLPGDPREHYIARMEWTPDSQSVLLQQLNRPQNTNRVMLCDPDSGSARTILVEQDEAWLENDNPVRWLADGKSFLWMSERTGWRHLYRAEIRAEADREVVLKPITSGEFDVISIETIDEKNEFVYFSASPEDPTRRSLYRVSLNGEERKRVSPVDQQGWHTYQFSPDASWAVHTYSNFTTPPVVSLVRLPTHDVVKTLADNAELKAKLAQISRPASEMFRIKTENAEMDGWCLKPAGFQPDQKYPLLFYVYGEPHGQTVRDMWQGNRGLWHEMLAQQGYLLVSIDNRGTNVPKGRQWRKCVYRQIGILASQDQAEATKALIEKWSYVDASRIGIWGWSGGGSMSLNAIFRYPDLYSTAVSVAPVADQRLYDTIYQERYMGLLDDNQDGYEQGSPVTFAKNLRGHLLVVHGSGDDNCHYQVTEKLINELIAQGKIFSQMPYPGRSHSLSEGKNTVPHFFDTLTRYFHANLPVNKASSEADAAEAPLTYQVRNILGWTINIRQELMTGQPEETEKALDLLQKQLEEIIRVVPSDAVAKLQRVTLWFSPEYLGVQPKAEYHPGERWLIQHGRNPAMVKGVEFTNVSIFEAECRRMPNFALHELSHAFHDQFLPEGFGNSEIIKAYDEAKSQGRYEKVEQRLGNGRSRVARSYALTTPMEYFAECTEAYYSTNDFFPFNRDQLLDHDPIGHDLIGRMWTSSH